MKTKILTLALMTFFQSSIWASPEQIKEVNANLEAYSKRHSSMLDVAFDLEDDAVILTRGAFVQEQLFKHILFMPNCCTAINSHFIAQIMEAYTTLTTHYIAFNDIVKKGRTSRKVNMMPFQKQTASYYENQLDQLGSIIEILADSTRDENLRAFVKSEGQRSVATRVDWLF